MSILSLTEDLIHAVLLGGASSSSGALFKGEIRVWEEQGETLARPTEAQRCRQDPGSIPAGMSISGRERLPAARDHSCPFSASSQPKFRPPSAASLLPAYSGQSRRRNAPWHACGTVGSGTWGNEFAFMFEMVFNFSTMESKIFHTCLGVRNLSTMSYKVQNQLMDPRLLAPSVLWVSLHSCGCPTTPRLSEGQRS